MTFSLSNLLLGRLHPARCAICMIFLSLILSGCITSYRAPKQPFGECEQYEKYLVDKGLVDLSAVKEKYPYLLVKDTTTSPPDEKLGLEGNNRISDYRKYPLIIVRYSEGGDLVSRCDYSRALRAVKKKPKTSKLVIVYVHGWNNDSGYNTNKLYNYGSFPENFETAGSNLRSFRTLLKKLQDQEDRKANQKKDVVGIYVSWKGSSQVPYLDYWSRKGAADRLGRSGQLVRLLSAIENIAREQNMTGQDNQLIYIGHSFGGRILYNAVAPALIKETQYQYERGKGDNFGNIKSVVDLVVLINPVLDSAAYKSINEFRLSGNAFEDRQAPLMVTISSETDWPNKYLFPAGESFGLLADPYQGTNRLRVVGSRKDFRTHQLVEIGDPLACTANCKWFDDFSHDEVKLVRSTKNRVADGRSGTRRLYPSPFLVVKVSKTILDGHGWFQTDKMEQFKGDYVQFLGWLTGFIERRAQCEVQYNEYTGEIIPETDDINDLCATR